MSGTTERGAASILEDDCLSTTATVGSRRPHSWNLDSFLPVDQRGLFFQDSFFQDAQQNFQAAVKDVLTKFGTSDETSVDDLTLYRTLRRRDLGDESQAVKITENHHSHQVVMDVRDYIKGDIKVKVVGDDEVQVEGEVLEEEEEGGNGAKSRRRRRRFHRRFHLPGVKVEEVEGGMVTAGLSSDGVLTLTVPKKLVTTASL
ncbi:hypothetical protein Pcinc_040066 [Petrolisthes cinctipes]|uniref:SHSP domain-containing protein n=1 Tax=Petrolisthes cinctipes TaxID=88211 RepID=A0AAE1BMZ2_PETCI|nr:hypothetical protein Pcinc_040066 [Petrolisthes cinctipes]